MGSEELSSMFNQIANVAEMLGGMRKQLISQGFSPDIAEQIIVETMRSQNASAS